MIKRRWAVAGLTLLASLAFTTSACGTTTPTSSGGGGDSPQMSAADLLASAGQKVVGQSYTFNITYGDLLTGSGAQDASAKKAQADMTISEPTSGAKIQVGMRLIGSDMYMKLDLGALGASIPGFGDLANKWMHIDASKMPADLTLGLGADSDSVGAESFFKGVTSVQKVGDNEYQGTIDLTKAKAGVLQQSQIEQLGESAKAIPFDATLDKDGRPTKVVLKMPAVAGTPAADLTVTYADYGSPVAVAKPAAAETIEAPSSIYGMFNG